MLFNSKKKYIEEMERKGKKGKKIHINQKAGLGDLQKELRNIIKGMM